LQHTLLIGIGAARFCCPFKGIEFVENESRKISRQKAFAGDRRVGAFQILVKLLGGDRSRELIQDYDEKGQS
jgi:hypothetical protein